MLTVRLVAGRTPAAVLAWPVAPAAEGAAPLPTVVTLPQEVISESVALLDQVAHTGGAGLLHALPRPLGQPRRLLLVGVGEGDEAGWRAAGAALARAAARESSLRVALPEDVAEVAVRGLAEGLMLASYRFRLAARQDGDAAPPAGTGPSGGPDPSGAPGAAARRPRLRTVTLAVSDPGRYQPALGTTEGVGEETGPARDLTNTPAMTKTPSWFVRRVTTLSRAHPALTASVRDVASMREGGFGGIVAVGAGSAAPPRLLELAWRPRGARVHVVLVGKGITFDTGGVSIKPRDSMTLMRKDVGGAAAVVAATLGAAALKLPVRLTTLAPLAENMPSGSALRPGDVVRHWGGRTTEVRNTDAEGRLVLADALAYAAARLRPDVLVDLATLTGANAVALGKRTAALYSDNTELATALADAGAAAGERLWRMPLPMDYVEALGSDLADIRNSSDVGAGSVMAALYLREFTGAAREQWVHIDMSAPSWIEKDEAELSRGATGWGVRTLLRWLETLAP